MPAITTHNLFAKDVVKKLDKNILGKFNSALNYYYIASQSFNVFMYYNIFNLKNGRKIRRYSEYFHNNNTQFFFINLIRNIIASNNQNNPIALAYLFGMINHYALDSACHPFVIYKTGVFDKHNKNSYKYSGLHARMEFMLDAFMYTARTGKVIHKYKFKDDLTPKIEKNTELIKIINKTFKDTFNKENMAELYFKSVGWQRLLYRMFIYDKNGFKKKFYKIYDKFTPPSTFKFEFCSYYIRGVDYTLINHEHKTWHNPADKSITSTTSFIDLYDNAVKNSVDIITQVNQVLENKKDFKSLLEIIKNISYCSGLDISKKHKLEFFEF